MYNPDIIKLSQSMPFSYEDCMIAYDMWADMNIAEAVLTMANVKQCSVSYIVCVFDTQFAMIDRQNNRSIAELQILLIQRGWF